MNTIWLLSDWHWRHENVYKFVDAAGIRIRHRFANAAEGDAFIEQGIRDTVKPSDHLWFLGDACMNRGNHQVTEFINLWKSLPGHKRIVPGNHDHYRTSVYADAGFEKVSGGRLLDGVLMTHYPVHESSLGPRVVGNAHGHTHQNPDIGPRYLNVCVERTGYLPIALEEVKRRFAEKLTREAASKPASHDVSGNYIGGQP